MSELTLEGGPVEEPVEDIDAAETEEEANEARWAVFRAKISDCDKVKRDLIPDWTDNIDYRRGKSGESDSDNSRSFITLDWSNTKTKQTSLYSQTPQVIVGLEGGDDSPYKPAVPVFQRRLNKRLRDSKIGVAMDEVLPDIINAAGIGAYIVVYEARTEDRQVPEFDVNNLTMMQKIQQSMGVFQNKMISRPFVTDRRFTAKRISPADLIWDTSFVGSDFDDSALVGRKGRIPWAEAKRKFNLDITQKEKVCGDDRTDMDRLSSNDESKKDNSLASYSELFYWRYKFHPEEPSYKAIHHIVFLKGIDKPVIDEPWKGQKYDPQTGEYIGSCKFPIRAGTLTYLSDEAIPPSDSAMARAAINELIEYRINQKDQRKHSIPVRWFDANRVDTDVQTNLMQGYTQGMVPVQGDGTKILGEVARANYPRDSRETEVSLMNDVNGVWRQGPNQQGTMARSGEHSATEAEAAQENYMTGVSYERNRIVNLFLGGAEVMAGLIMLHDDFDMSAELTDTDKQKMQSLNLKRINQEAVFSIRADSTVMIDSNQEFKRLERFLNITAKSGYLYAKPIHERMAALSQIDPSLVVVDPNPAKPEEPNISYRFSGEDMINPIVLAILAKAGQIPAVEDLEAIFKLIKAAGITPEMVNPEAKEGTPTPEEVVPENPHPEWNTMDRIEKRSSERGAQ